jgi:hypothetical protein
LRRRRTKLGNSAIGRRAYDTFRPDCASPAIRPAAYQAAGLMEASTPCRQAIDAG